MWGTGEASAALTLLLVRGGPVGVRGVGMQTGITVSGVWLLCCHHRQNSSCRFHCASVSPM